MSAAVHRNDVWDVQADLGFARYGLTTVGIFDQSSYLAICFHVAPNTHTRTRVRLICEAAVEFGLPKSIRDYEGPETSAFAVWLEDQLEERSGPYILHCKSNECINTHQVNRPWQDAKIDILDGWRQRFTFLETSRNLDVHDADQVWLLHELFLDHINADARSWRTTWNTHFIRTAGMGLRFSPACSWAFGAASCKGMLDEDMSPDRRARGHVRIRNSQESAAVPLDDPVPSLSEQEIALLRRQFATLPASNNAEGFVKRWEQGLELYKLVITERMDRSI